MREIQFDKDYYLCYIEGNFAYFTNNLEKQWGDDWDDKPYEHNAGRPYEHHDTEVVKVAFESYLETPAEIASINSNYSVEDINNKETPWLSGEKGFSVKEIEMFTGKDWNELSKNNPLEFYKLTNEIINEMKENMSNKVEIYAGTTLTNFVQKIVKNDGEIFMKIERNRKKLV